MYGRHPPAGQIISDGSDLLAMTLLDDLGIDWIRSSNRRFAATVLEPLLRDHRWLSREKRRVAC